MSTVATSRVLTKAEAKKRRRGEITGGAAQKRAELGLCAPAPPPPPGAGEGAGVWGGCGPPPPPPRRRSDTVPCLLRPRHFVITFLLLILTHCHCLRVTLFFADLKVSVSGVFRFL